MRKILLITAVLLFMIVFTNVEHQKPVFQETIKIQLGEDELAVITLMLEDSLCILIKDQELTTLIDLNGLMDMELLKTVLNKFNITKVDQIYILNKDLEVYNKYNTTFNSNSRTNIMVDQLKGEYFVTNKGSIDFVSNQNFIIRFNRYNIFVVNEPINYDNNIERSNFVNSTMIIANSELTSEYVDKKVITIFYRKDAIKERDLEHIYTSFIDTQLLRKNEARIIKLSKTEFNLFSFSLK